MKARKLVMVTALIVVAGGFGATSGLAHMRQTYNGVCGQLTGVPGLLQKMHFFNPGDCKIAPDVLVPKCSFLPNFVAERHRLW